MTSTASAPLNHIATKSGRVRAVCQCCGTKSRAMAADDEGEPNLWGLPFGWSMAPFPADFRHRDGSVGSTYTCPTCNERAGRGETLRLRAQAIFEIGGAS